MKTCSLTTFEMGLSSANQGGEGGTDLFTKRLMGIYVMKKPGACTRVLSYRMEFTGQSVS